MNRRHFAKRSLALCAVAFGATSLSAAQEIQSTPAKPAALELGKEIKIELESQPVTWRTHDYVLAAFHKVQFDFDPKTHRLTAKLDGMTVTFDDMNYEVSGAVFDSSGALLGAGRTDCKVARTWLGKALTAKSVLSLDFGISLDYPKAESFQLSISNRPVLTPDQWVEK